MNETANRTPHARAWFYVSLLFAQAPVGTHPLDNARLLEHTAGPSNLSEMLLTMQSVSLHQGFSGGAA